MVLKDEKYPSEIKDGINKTLASLRSLLLYMDTATKDEKITDKTNPETNKIIDLTFNLFKTMNLEHYTQSGDQKLTEPLKKEHVHQFWLNLGRASSTPFEVFVYTRLFQIFYYHVTVVEHGQVTDKKTKQKKTADAKEEFSFKHGDFARFMVKAFLNPADCKEIGFVKKFFLPTLPKDSELEIDQTKKAQYFHLIDVQPGQTTPTPTP
jgi:hypothetical protein